MVEKRQRRLKREKQEEEKQEKIIKQEFEFSYRDGYYYEVDLFQL